MDLTDLDATVRFFSDQGIANSTRKTYQSSLALCKFANFCEMYSVLTPFPVSESILCYYASFLASQNFSPQTIKTYLAGIRHMQITLGLPEPKEYSSQPRLRLVQTGIKRAHSQKMPLVTKLRLPITPGPSCFSGASGTPCSLHVLARMSRYFWQVPEAGGPTTAKSSK